MTTTPNDLKQSAACTAGFISLGMFGQHKPYIGVLGTHAKVSCIDIMDFAAKLAVIATDFAESLNEEDWPGVFDYEVSEPMGEWLAKYIMRCGMPSLDDAVAELIGCMAEFFAAGDDKKDHFIKRIMALPTEYNVEAWAAALGPMLWRKFAITIGDTGQTKEELFAQFGDFEPGEAADVYGTKYALTKRAGT